MTAINESMTIMSYPKSIQQLITDVSKLPGIGRKHATRVVFELIRQDQTYLNRFGEHIINAKRAIQVCKQCHTITDADKKYKGLCEICRNPKRKKNIVTVVEKISDLEAIENVGIFPGTYHIVGKLFPRKAKQKGDTAPSVKSLVNRIKSLKKTEKNIEVILALNPTSDGTLSNLYLKEVLSPLAVSISQIGRGIPTGGELEYADKETLTEAMSRRSKA